MPIRETLHLVFALMPARVAFTFLLHFCTLAQSVPTPQRLGTWQARAASHFCTSFLYFTFALWRCARRPYWHESCNGSSMVPGAPKGRPKPAYSGRFRGSSNCRGAKPFNSCSRIACSDFFALNIFLCSCKSFLN